MPGHRPKLAGGLDALLLIRKVVHAIEPLDVCLRKLLDRPFDSAQNRPVEGLGTNELPE